MMNKPPFPYFLAILLTVVFTLGGCASRQPYDPLADIFGEAASPAAPEDFDALRAKIHGLANEAVERNKQGDEAGAQERIDAAKVLILTFEGSANQRDKLAAEYDLLLALLDEMIDPDSRAPADLFEVTIPPEPTAEDLAQVEAARSIPSMQRYLSGLPRAARRRVAQQLAYFTRTTSGRKWFQRSLNRSAAYRAEISEVLARYELPAELLGVALIESGFSERAVSHAGASGMWQFMPATGRGYGLQLDGWVDERLDWKAATDAAARYLKGSMELYDGNIELAVASYNTGPGNVNKAVRRAGSHSYWKLHLHRETMAYVPKWIASMIVYYNPKQYGFVVPSDDPQRYDTIRIRGSIELGAIAGAISEHPKQVFALNQALLRKATPPDRPWDVRLPLGSREQLLANLDSLMQDQSVVWVAHRLRRGESLGTLAKLYQVSVERLVSVNKWVSDSLPEAGEVIMVPVAADNEAALARVAKREREAVAAAAAAAKAQAKVGNVKTYRAKTKAVRYKVRRRDTLWSISQRFGVSVDDLRAKNKSKVGRRDRILVGDTLTVSGGRGSSVAAQPDRTHTVRRGDSLGKIAAKHRVSTKALASYNGIKTSTTIYPGTVLKIPTGGRAPERKHTVRRGDSLSKIAAKYHVSTAKLASRNGIKTSTTIYPGMVLKVPGGSGRAAAPVRYHTVARGDTLSGIAKKFGVRYQALAAYNGLTTKTVLRPGQRLKVPPSSYSRAAKPKTIKYKVRPGDTLTKIAGRFGCTIGDLEKWNKIKRTRSLRVGQVLAIRK
jgi:peptidoglycan lytic transglycosylase D